jgi:hypothetical protein
LFFGHITSSLNKKREEGSIFYEAKGGIFFLLFLSNEPGTGFCCSTPGPGEYWYLITKFMVALSKLHYLK